MKKQTKLIFYCLAMCIVAVACIFGVLAVKNFSLVSGGVIKFVAPGVDATISDATLTGLSKKASSGTMSTFTVTSTMTASQIEALDGYKSWSGIHLLFDDESEGKGTISFTITNNSSKSIENIMVELSTNTTSASAIQTTPSADFCIAPGASHTFSVNLSVVNVDESVILDDFELVVDLGVIKESQVTSVEEYQASGLTFATNSSARTASFTQFAIPQGTTENLQVEIPSVVKDSAGNVYTVTEIKGSSSTNNPFASVADKMTKVTLPETLTTIGVYAFYNCSALSGELVIPDGVTTIGHAAFYSCKGLTGELKLPASLKTIGNNSFQYCDGFSGDLIIPEGVETLGSGVFYACLGITGKLLIPSTLKTIGSSCFYSCNQLTSIEVASSNSVFYSQGDCLIEKSNGNLIQGCNNSVIPDNGSIKSIGSCAFYKCLGMTGDLIIPEGVTIINNSAFYNCTGYNGQLVLPSTLVSIGNHAFYYCSSFVGELVIPSNVATIGNNAFMNCGTFSGELIIPAKTTSIGDTTFYNCGKFANITVDNANTVYRSSASNCLIERSTGKLLKGSNSAIIPTDGTITEIVEGAFYGCTSWEQTLTISSSITKIGSMAFYNCNKITGIVVDSENPSYYSINNCLIEKATGTLLKGCNISVIPTDSTITSIADHAFRECRELSGDLIIPNNIKSIGYAAFAYCTGYNKSLQIPAGVTFIDKCVFIYIKFTSIVVDSNNKAYYDSGNCLIEKSTGTLLKGGNNSIIPNDGTIKIISRYAFSGCSNLASIIIPESVTEINYLAFERCTALTSIVVPQNVTFIGDYVFKGCTSLTSITIMATVPPTLGKIEVFTNTNNCPIYVPAASVAAYKTAPNWSSYASRIQAISA